MPPTEKLPDGIGGPVLRTAAMKGDPTAAYEVAVRFAEGRGIASNYEEAAKWYDRAAQAGVIPATFRLGTLYEKGLGVKKDPDIAARYYMQAAERGNAKAMHNLAVLAADGRALAAAAAEGHAFQPFLPRLPIPQDHLALRRHGLTFRRVARQCGRGLDQPQGDPDKPGCFHSPVLLGS